jgi:hypothetical protein
MASGKIRVHASFSGQEQPAQCLEVVEKVNLAGMQWTGGSL